MSKSSEGSQTRKRGIRASRVKLEKAMANAGFRTQAALASHIADLEMLDSAPRDFVSRIFREHSVAPASIERIANALNVEAYTLYKSNAEDEIPSPSPKEEIGVKNTKEPQELSKNRLLLPILICSVIIFITLLLWQFSRTHEPSKNSGHGIKGLENISIAVLDFSHPKLVPFSNILRKSLANKFKSPSNASIALNHDLSAWKTVDKLKVDYVLEGEILSYGQNLGLLLYLVNQDSKKLIASFSGLELENTNQNIQTMIQNVEQAIDHFFNTNSSELPIFLNKEALTYYLQSQQQLDGSSIEINIRRALDFIQRSLRIEPNFAKTKATLCDILVRQSIINGDKTLLNDAETECQHAQSITSSFAELHFAFGQVRRKQGRTDEAIDLYKKALDIFPNYVDAHFGLAESYINKVQQTQNKEFFENALQHITKAKAHKPEFWKVPFVASRVHYFQGDVTTAIAELEQSKEMYETFNNLANLGTLYFCQGNMQQAQLNYLKLEDLNGASGMTDNYLGVINFALENYQDSVTYFTASMDKMLAEGSEGLYLAWINLGDAYFANSQLEKAQEAYQHSIVIADRNLILGENENNIRAHIFYSNLKLTLSKNKIITSTHKKRLLEELETIASKATDPDALVRIMLSWVELDEIEKGRRIFNTFAATCKGYADYPLVRKYFN